MEQLLALPNCPTAFECHVNQNPIIGVSVVSKDVSDCSNYRISRQDVSSKRTSKNCTGTAKAVGSAKR
jgi:hypothetical protein